MYITLKNYVDIRKKLIEPANVTLVCFAYALTILCNQKKTQPFLKSGLGCMENLHFVSRDMVSVTTASRNMTSASLYQSRP